MRFCDVCTVRSTTIIYVSMTRALCRKCCRVERTTLKKLILKLPEIAPLALPQNHFETAMRSLVSN